MIEIRTKDKDKSNFYIEERNLIDIHAGNPMKRVEDSNVCYQIDNWVRLGLISSGFDKKLAGDDSYSWIQERPEYKRIKEVADKNGREVTYERGYIEKTSLGAQFARVVGIIKS